MQGDSVWEHLQSKSASILGRWSQLILETYPADTSKFLRDEKDRFANPVGYVVSNEARTIFDELLHGMDSDRLASSLGDIIRIRAVQDFSPSQAVGIVYLLKQAVREEMAGGISGDRYFSELLDFESRIDQLALMAFDIYMGCRDKICEIKVGEIAAQRDMAMRVLVRVGETNGEGDPS